MYREIINTIPFNLLIIVLVISFVLVTFAISRISNYWILDKDGNKHIQLADNSISILTGGFFILLAFIIINTWNYQQEARNAVAKEADCLAVILKDIHAFPPQPQAQISKAAGDYIVAVRVSEWELMRAGKSSATAWNNLDQLYSSVRAFQPQTAQEKIYYTAIVSSINCVLEYRRNRLDKIDSIIPKQLRDSIVLGSLVFAIMLGILRGKDHVINLIPTLLFSALLGFNLAIALNLDYPFSGNISVSNSIFYQGALGKFSDP